MAGDASLASLSDVSSFCKCCQCSSVECVFECAEGAKRIVWLGLCTSSVERRRRDQGHSNGK